MVDLHVHSTASDGTMKPSELVELAKNIGLRGIAITDHDNTGGCREAMAKGAKLGVRVIPGIEISTKHKGAVHILGYGIDLDSPVLKTATDWELNDRAERNKKICALMQADGLPVYWEDMRSRFGEAMGRPHFGRRLVELGVAESINDAFARFLNRGEKYYIGRSYLSIDESIRIITGSGGTAVLAHPFQYKLTEAELRELIELCIGCGLTGMECRYSGYTEEQSGYLEKLAEEYGLIRTGGSDFHGANKPHIALGTGTGGLHVPDEWMDKLG